MPRRTILTIEDDAAIRRGIADALTFAGYSVRQGGIFDDGLRLALAQPCDLILLDIVLPGGSGLDILREVREARPRQPVILLTARGDEDDRVAGLKLGADDYVVKPFSVRELLARVEAVLRRMPRQAERSAPIELPGWGTIDLERNVVRFSNGTQADLSPREADLLRYFSGRASQVVTRDELLAEIWGLDAQGITTRTIDMHVARLREKLNDDAADPRIVLTVRGKGYLFQAPPC